MQRYKVLFTTYKICTAQRAQDRKYEASLRAWCAWWLAWLVEPCNTTPTLTSTSHFKPITSTSNCTATDNSTFNRGKRNKPVFFHEPDAKKISRKINIPYFILPHPCSLNKCHGRTVSIFYFHAGASYQIRLHRLGVCMILRFTESCVMKSSTQYLAEL